MNEAPKDEWVAVEVVAECYGVEVEWLYRVEELGVLSHVQHASGGVRIAVTELDRVAAVVRWHRHLGLDLETVAALLLAQRSF